MNGSPSITKGSLNISASGEHLTAPDEGRQPEQSRGRTQFKRHESDRQSKVLDQGCMAPKLNQTWTKIFLMKLLTMGLKKQILSHDTQGFSPEHLLDGFLFLHLQPDHCTSSVTSENSPRQKHISNINKADLWKELTVLRAQIFKKEKGFLIVKWKPLSCVQLFARCFNCQGVTKKSSKTKNI